MLIESTTNQPRELPSPGVLPDLSCTEPVGAEADLPAMLEAARDYIQANRTGRTEIWICSDLRENDWHADSGRWRTLRESFLELPQGVRFHLLAYPQAAPDNMAVRVTGVRRQQSGERAELLVSLLLLREGDADDKVTIPVRIRDRRGPIRSDMSRWPGPQYELKDYRIALEGKRERGWGRVSIPADANPADNDFYFVFDKPAPRKADHRGRRPAGGVAVCSWRRAISPDPASLAMRKWCRPNNWPALPGSRSRCCCGRLRCRRTNDARLVQAFVERGGQVIFLPPRHPGAEEFLGMRWGRWVDCGEEASVETWRGDQDLLAHTLSGEALPVGDLKVRRYCQVSGEFTTLAAFAAARRCWLASRRTVAASISGATTPAPADSSLAADAVVLYVAVQRAMASGAAVLGNTRNLIAGRPPADIPGSWERLAGDRTCPVRPNTPSNPEFTGPANGCWPSIVPSPRTRRRYWTIRAWPSFSTGWTSPAWMIARASAKTLVQEIWRLFLEAMIVAMVCEAGLCLPKLRRKEGAAS